VGPEPPPRRPRRRSGGVAVIAGGLLQDLEDRVRRDLAPIEERVRPGEETRGLAGGTGEAHGDPVVIVLPAAPAAADPA
jgi:hypothetical protein